MPDMTPPGAGLHHPRLYPKPEKPQRLCHPMPVEMFEENKRGG